VGRHFAIGRCRRTTVAELAVLDREGKAP